jgi:tRNA modification GTPase
MEKIKPAEAGGEYTDINKTIAAISTPVGTGGIAVIRVSGERAVQTVDMVFRGKEPLGQAPTHTVHYGHIISADATVIDEVLVTVMRAPRTFTREDVVEISTHGGLAVSRMVLERLIEAGAYPAEAGEFTKRAFLNGRIDLSQAEAVIDIISARTNEAQKNAQTQLAGTLSSKIDALRETLISLSARMQVAIDYPDEDLENVTINEIERVCRDTLAATRALLDTADSGRILREGISTAIIGRPNVGKSSVLNILSQTEKSIVTDIPGTTRDVVEEYVSVGGVMLRLLDTAGIRDTDDAVEKIGVERSRKSIEEADLALAVINGSSEFSDDDKAILRLADGKRCIVLVNKSDLGASNTADDVRDFCADCDVLEVSAKTGAGFDVFADRIAGLYGSGALSQSGGVIITNARHRAALSRAAEALEKAADALVSGMPQDIASIDISAAAQALGEITGAAIADDVVENIFHNFCVGK